MPPVETTTPEPQPEPQAEAHPTSRSEAVRRAEQFVREQGYTEVAPVQGTALQLESLDDPDNASELRRGTLSPRAVNASHSETGWMVFFAYSDEAHPERGRALRVGNDRSFEMVHQDAVLPDGIEPLRLTARFRRFLSESPDCGTLHLAGVAEYEVVSVQEGDYEPERIMVVHGCPELARAAYEAEAGDVTEFVAGEIHQLTLAVHVPTPTGGISVMDLVEFPELHRYWAETTNLVPSVESP